MGYVALLKVTNSPEYKPMLCLSVLVGVPGSFIWLNELVECSLLVLKEILASYLRLKTVFLPF